MATGCKSFSARNLWVKSVQSQHSVGSLQFLFYLFIFVFSKEISVNEVDKFLSVRTVLAMYCILLTLWKLWGKTVFIIGKVYKNIRHPPIHFGILNIFCCLLGYCCAGKGVWLKPQVKHQYLGHGFHGGHWRDKRWEHVFLMQTALI